MVPGERASGTVYSVAAGADADRHDGGGGGAQPRPHSSGFRTFLNWFKRVEVTRRSSGGQEPPRRTPEPDTDEGDSSDSETSTATAASFAFLSPAGYRPYGDALAPHKYIASGPYTDTYRRRVAERERRRCLDSGVTLRKKYQLHSADATLAPLRETHSPDPLAYDTFSLPAMSKRSEVRDSAPAHRRAASDTKFVRPTSYVHVKGKRRAPPPPSPAVAAATRPLSATLTRRVKRLAPPPPTVAPASSAQTPPTPPASSVHHRASEVVTESLQPSVSPKVSPSTPRLSEVAANVTETTSVASVPPTPVDTSCTVKPSAPPLTKMWLATSSTKNNTPAQGESSSPNSDRIGEVKPLLLHSKSEESWKPPATAKDNCELSPRPWYKRQFSENKTKSKSCNEESKVRSKPELPDLGFFRYSKIFESKRNSTSPKGEDKRLSHALPNISELDREAAEILQLYKKGTLEENNNIGKDGDAPNFSNPRSARLLISKFNELNKGKPIKSCDPKGLVKNSPIFKSKIARPTAAGEPSKETEKIQLQAALPEARLKSGDDTWVCMRCEKRNNCKKLMCSACFSKKPKEFDLFSNNIKQDLLKSFESEVLDALAHLGNMSKDETVGSSNSLNASKEDKIPKEAVKVAKDKMEEQQKLRQMLKEMKNSLPKQPKPGGSAVEEKSEVNVGHNTEDFKADKNSNVTIIQQVIVAQPTTALSDSSTVSANDKTVTKTPIPKKSPNQCNSSAQTQSNAVIPQRTKSNIQPGTDINNSLYANVQVPIPLENTQIPSTSSEAKNPKLLLKELETAISKGDDKSAAEIAKRLAHMKINCTMMSSNATLVKPGKPGNDDEVTVEVYIEDAESAAGPVRLRVRRAVTMSELRAAVQRQLDIPAPLQRWIVGKQLCVDDAPLAVYNGGDFTQPLFLYLVSPAKAEADLTKESKQPSEIADNTAMVTKTFTTPAPSTSGDVRASSSASASPAITPERTKPEPATDAAPPADHYRQLVQLENQELIPNTEAFTCGICLDPCAREAGVVLRECLHQFCRGCLGDTVRHCDAAQVLCPYRDAQYACDSALQEREVRALVSAADLERHLAKSVQLAESSMRGAFHCKTADCRGWCVYENTVNIFRCPICRKTNCLTCQAIHVGENCAEYQERVRREAAGGGAGAAEAERTRRMLEDMCARGDALVCPSCQVVLMKKWGCDWVRCSMCKTEICWVTRGARWGPAGRGDTSAGCRCGVGGIKCHPSCNYCH